MSKPYSVPSNYLFLATFLLLLPCTVLGECTCDAEEETQDRSLARKYQIVAIASILFASTIGVCIPGLGKVIPALSPEKNFFFVLKAFAAGVILSTGFIHVLPDAFESLTSACIPVHPWSDFPFTGFIAMVSAIGTLMVDTYATAYFGRMSLVKAQETSDTEVGVVPVHSHATHGSIGLESNSGEADLLRHRVVSQVLELGIIVHSVIIGIALGASQNPTTIKPLMVALTFHQFFEGIGLGGCITQAKFRTKAVVIMTLFFSLTTPLGIAIGMGISNVYSETSPTALIVSGVFDSASAGILIYMALVDLLAADFMSPKMQNSGKLQLAANASLLFGAACMSILAKWA